MNRQALARAAGVQFADLASFYLYFRLIKRI